MNINNKLNKYKLHYKILGRGKPVIFIHGWNGLSDSIAKFDFIHKSAEKYKIYLIDLPGYGKSLPLEKYSFAGLCEIIKSFLDEEGLERIYLFGICSGSVIALDFFIRNPLRVEKIFLVEPSFIFPKSLLWLCPFVKKFPFFGNFLFYSIVKNKIILRLICGFLSTNKNAIDLNQFIKSKAKVSVDYMLMLYEYSKVNHYLRLDDIKDKVKDKAITIFIGANTGKDIKATAFNIKKIMKNCEVIEISDSSHFPIDENTKKFAEVFYSKL